MTTRTTWQSMMAVTGIVLLSITGCSDNPVVGSYDSTTVVASSITYYFPVEPGYTSTFEIRESDGRLSQLTFKVGNKVPFAATSAIEWYHQNGSGFDTSYVAISGGGIYLYESSGSTPERILQGPVKPGSIWTRYPVVDSQGDTTSIVTGETDLGDIVDKDDENSGDNGGGAAKTFPTTGSNELSVERIEPILLSSGSSFSGCAKVVNQLSDGSENQYWFAPGYGLVKWVIGATQGYPSGRQSGEMVGFIK